MATVFRSHSDLIRHNPAQRHYGVAVTDLDHDGQFELYVATFGGANRMLKWDGTGYTDLADDALADSSRQAIGVAAADIDGDGHEEIYVLNTDTFAGVKRFGDRLLRATPQGWVDLFSLPVNRGRLNLTAGRSVACVDRLGTGRYGFYVANYGGPVRVYECADGNQLNDVAEEAGLNFVTGGRAVVSLPLISDRMDLFAANENSPNFLFVNQGDGTFEEMAAEWGVDDPDEHGRGVAVLDANDDGRFDLVYGNWEGPHRLFVRDGDRRFHPKAPRLLQIPSKVRTVLAADFDNDGYEEIFFHNIGEPNRLFAFREDAWVAMDTGDAWEPDGLGTGAAYGDFDGDGRLELLLTHGESAAQPLSLFHGPENDHHYLRVHPLTRQGAPARGAVVRLRAGSREQVRAIDAGSGYLCQMEPVAHFGLGTLEEVESVSVHWPDGSKAEISRPAVDQVLRVPHPR